MGFGEDNDWEHGKTLGNLPFIRSREKKIGHFCLNRRQKNSQNRL